MPTKVGRFVRPPSPSSEDEDDGDVKLDVPEARVSAAIGALDKLNESRKRGPLSPEVPFMLQIECVKIPDCVTRKLRFVLPHSMVAEDWDICLFVADLKKGKRIDHEATVQHYEDILKKNGITNRKITVMPMRQVRVEYDQSELKRSLLTQYEVFLADARIGGYLAHRLGEVFRRKNKMPTPVRMDAKNLKQELERALSKTVTTLHGTGNTFTLRVSNGDLQTAAVCENIKAVLSQLPKVFPGGAENVRSLRVKTPLSMAIPLYISLKNPNNITRTVIKPLRPMADFVEGELSTRIGANVKVYPDGNVLVDKFEEDSEDSDVPDDEESKEEEVVVNKDDQASSSSEAIEEPEEDSRPRKKRKRV